MRRPPPDGMPPPAKPPAAKRPSKRPGKPPTGRIRRWLTILLPIVLVLRALLFVFQLNDDPATPEAAAPPWPPAPDQELRFRSDNPGIAAWAAEPKHAPVSAALIEKDFTPMPPDTGCMLNPLAMARHGGGSLTLVSHQPSGDWLASWSGTSTMPTLEDSETDAGKADLGDHGDPQIRKLESAMLTAADCGASARLELTEPALHRLVNLLTGLPPPDPAPDPAPTPRRELKIRVEGPPPP